MEFSQNTNIFIYFFNLATEKYLREGVKAEKFFHESRGNSH